MAHGPSLGSVVGRGVAGGGAKLTYPAGAKFNRRASSRASAGIKKIRHSARRALRAAFVNAHNLIVASSVLASCAHADQQPHEEN